MTDKSSLSRLEKLPPEALQNVAYHTVCSSDTFLGPPTTLSSLLLTSHSVNDGLAFHSASLYANIFRFKFDYAAPFRRLPLSWLHTPSLAAELKKRFAVLKRIRHAEQQTVWDSVHVSEEDLWCCYLMLMESDGKNESQLLDWAKLNLFVYKTLCGIACSPPPVMHTWYLSIERSSLLVWLFWMTTNQEYLEQESEHVRRMLTMLLHPFLSRGHQYPTLYTPDSHFTLPLCGGLESPAPFCSGPSPPLATIKHFDHKLRLSAPVLVSAAMLSMIVRKEANPIPSYNLPPNREAANALGRLGPTLEDIIEYHHRTRTVLPTRCPLDNSDDALDDNASLGSRRHDQDWSRLVSCCDPWRDARILRGPVYTPGSLSGPWGGRFLVPPLEEHMRLILDSRSPPASVPLLARPLYANFHEHHCLTPDLPLLPGDDKNGGDDILNAWLPRGFTIKHLEDAIEVFDPVTNRNIRYETFFPRRTAPYSKPAGAKLQTHWISQGDQETSEVDSDSDDDSEWSDVVERQSSGVADILVTGETEERHGDAWGSFMFIGRVRPWDGLVAILRIPMNSNQHLGRWIFKGYIHDQNFVGRWRETSTDVNMVGHEGSFVMARLDDV